MPRCWVTRESLRWLDGLARGGGHVIGAQAVESHGLLLLCDNRLPSVTLLLAGEPIKGSWWGHPNGKVTLVHQRLWGDLAAVGAEGAALAAQEARPRRSGARP